MQVAGDFQRRFGLHPIPLLQISDVPSFDLLQPRAGTLRGCGRSGEMRETLHEFEFRGETEDLGAFLSGGVRISSARAVRSSPVRVGR